MENTDRHEKIKKALEELSHVSQAATRILKSGHGYASQLLYYTYENSGRLTFHPNGICGCIDLQDGYCIDIRCNHLIWLEGTCEPLDDYVWPMPNEPVIMIQGNHKGLFCSQLIF